MIKLQGGVFRTNCIDCLDRTNVTQAKVTARVVQDILDYIKNSTSSAKGEMQFDGAITPLSSFENDRLFEHLRDMWVKNGDQLSMQYTGTESNISRVTKQGS